MRIRIAVFCLMMGLAMPTAGASDGEAAELVTAFNQALSNRDMETMLSLLADGAVRFNLRPSHQGLTEDTLAQDLKLHWQTVGSVLFSVTETYQRSIQVTAVHVDADLATVWVETQTRSVSRSDGSECNATPVRTTLSQRANTEPRRRHHAVDGAVGHGLGND